MKPRKAADETYVRDLIAILRPHSTGLSRHLVLSHIERLRKSKGLSIPSTFGETVQSSFNQHCIQSEVFRRRNAPQDGFFHSIRFGNTAIWSVDAQRADMWLRIPSSSYELARAIARIKGVPLEKALLAVDKAVEEQRKEWRGNLQVKAVIAQLRAETAKEAL